MSLTSTSSASASSAASMAKYQRKRDEWNTFSLGRNTKATAKGRMFYKVFTKKLAKMIRAGVLLISQTRDLRSKESFTFNVGTNSYSWKYSDAKKYMLSIAKFVDKALPYYIKWTALREPKPPSGRVTVSYSYVPNSPGRDLFGFFRTALNGKRLADGTIFNLDQQYPNLIGLRVADRTTLVNLTYASLYALQAADPTFIIKREEPIRKEGKPTGKTMIRQYINANHSSIASTIPNMVAAITNGTGMFARNEVHKLLSHGTLSSTALRNSPDGGIVLSNGTTLLEYVVTLGQARRGKATPEITAAYGPVLGNLGEEGMRASSVRQQMKPALPVK